MLVEVAKIANSGEFDYLLIESTGVSEPMPVAGKSALVLFYDVNSCVPYVGASFGLHVYLHLIAFASRMH